MAKPILFVDAYQTCIETGKDALEKSLEEAFTTLSQRDYIKTKNLKILRTTIDVKLLNYINNMA